MTGRDSRYAWRVAWLRRSGGSTVLRGHVVVRLASDSPVGGQSCEGAEWYIGVIESLQLGDKLVLCHHIKLLLRKRALLEHFHSNVVRAYNTASTNSGGDQSRSVVEARWP